MKIGKCLKTDLYIGCSVDVSNLADRYCSGKQTCNVFIPDMEMGAQVNCLEDESLLGAAYLEAGYTCQKGKQNGILHILLKYDL